MVSGKRKKNKRVVAKKPSATGASLGDVISYVSYGGAELVGSNFNDEELCS